MTKRMLIDATHAEETRVVVLDGNRLENFDVETSAKKQLKGNIYLAKVVRVEPSLQAAFVEYGGGRHGFLAFGEIHPDYYQIPVADRQRLLALQAEEARAEAEAEDREVEGAAAPRRPEPARAPRQATAMAVVAAPPPVTEPETAQPAADATEAEGAVPADLAGPAGVAEILATDNGATDNGADEARGDEATADHATVEAATFDDARAEAPVSRASADESPRPEDPVADSRVADVASDEPERRDGPARTMAMARDERFGPADAEVAETPIESLDIDPSETTLEEPPLPRAPEPIADQPGDAFDVNPPDAFGIDPPGAFDTDPPGALDTDPPGALDTDPAVAADTMHGDAATGGAPLPAERDADEDGFADIDVVGEPAPPPETIGGDTESTGSDDARRRRESRFLRNYRIQEVIRRRQIMLIQVVKEERGTKGAALTTYISLAGRFSVLMPNSPRGGGISRKITSAADRRRLKEVTAELDLPQGMGLIVRTAGANRPKPEIKRDCEYLMRLWDDIRELTLRSIAPALIYEEASLIKRAIRDVYSRDIDEIVVDGEAGWRAARDFMRMLMPSHANKVQLWRGEGGQPLFAKHQVEAQLDAMLSPTVQLKSGGYLVINQTEALVAIDVNSGRSTRERNVEETAFRTNLEAADEAARQLRLRDLAGLIVIDFIDMEVRKNNAAVERRLKDALREDRARIQVGSISHFGLLEMSRQRLRPSLAETSFVVCPHCGGSGHVRSTETAAIHILRAIEDEGARGRSAVIMLHAASSVVMFLLNHKRDRLSEIETRSGMRVQFAMDEALVPPAHRIERVRARGADDLPVPPPPPMPTSMGPAFEVPDEAPDVFEPEDETPDIDSPVAAAPRVAPNGTPNGVPTGTNGGGAETAEEGERRRRRRRRRRGNRRDTPDGQTLEAGGPDAGPDMGADGGEGPEDGADDGPDDAPEEPADLFPATAITAAGMAPRGLIATDAAAAESAEPVTVHDDVADMAPVEAGPSEAGPMEAGPVAAGPVAAGPVTAALAETALAETALGDAAPAVGEEDAAAVDGEATPARRRGRRGGRRRRREDGGEVEATAAAPAAASVAEPYAAPAYSGPTPADPFGGTGFDIYDFLDTAPSEVPEVSPARAPAARPPAAPRPSEAGAHEDGPSATRPSGKRPSEARPSEARPSEPPTASEPPAVAAPPAASDADAAVMDAPTPQPAAVTPAAVPETGPLTAQPVSAPATPVAEPAIGPPIEPVRIGEGVVAGERKRGWWRR